MSINTMSHEEATRSQAVERYILGELTQEEREAFEGHYFNCPACFDSVKLEMKFLRHAKQVLGQEPEKAWFARMLGDLRRPMPAFACAMLVCAVGVGAYQQTLIAHARQPRVEASYFLAAPNKGLEKAVAVPRKSRLSLTVDFEPQAELTSYRAQILGHSGKIKYTLPFKSVDTSVTIGLAADDLDAGKYSVVIQGMPREGVPVEVGSGSFDLQFID
jgi:hypothetical protein